MKLAPIEIAKRTLFALAIGIVLVQVIPSLADENTPAPQTLEEVSTAPSDLTTPQASPEPSMSAEPALTPAPLISTSPEASPSASAKPTSIPGASVMVRIPNSLKVDPRAQVVAVAPIHFNSSHDLLVCIASSKSALDMPVIPEALLANQSSANHLLISGKTGAVAQALGSLRLIGNLAESMVSLRFVAVTEPTLDGTLCGEANGAAQVRIQTLGLQQGLVKVPVDMAKKRK